MTDKTEQIQTEMEQADRLAQSKALELIRSRFVPQEPIVIHGPIPDKLPQFEGIDYPVGGKPKE